MNNRNYFKAKNLKCFLIFILFGSLVSHQVYSQCPTTVSLYTQADVDDFATNYPDCVSQGWVQSLRLLAADITDLSGLSSLDSVGYFIVSNTSLTDFSTLSNLKAVNQFNVYDNPLLTEIDGFENTITPNFMRITDNPELTVLSGFSNLEQSETIRLRGCPKLSSIAGLSNCKEVFVLDFENTALANFNEMTSLEYITQLLEIMENPHWDDLSKLKDLKYLPAIEVKDNPLLDLCCDLGFFSTANRISGFIRIKNNAAGCNSLADIFSSCPDGDHDGIEDASDNCAESSNPNQSDFDNDTVGDVCDNCPLVSNPLQTDSNSNGIGDACDNGQVVDGVRNDLGDIYSSAKLSGLILKAVDGKCYKIMMNIEGGIETTEVICP